MYCLYLIVYIITVQGNCPRISSISDKNNWKVVMNALPVIGFTDEEVQVCITIDSICIQTSMNVLSLEPLMSNTI